MLSVIFVLSCAVILGECSLTKRSGKCSDLNQCTFPLSQESTEELSKLSDAETYALFCTQKKDFEQCYETGKKGCNNEVVLNLLEGKVAVAEYICSPEGEKDLLSLLEFPCVSNSTLRLEVQKSISQCVQNFQLDLQISALSAGRNGRRDTGFNICSEVDELNACIVDGATNKCGPEVGQFVKRVWETASQPSFERFQCDARAN